MLGGFCAQAASEHDKISFLSFEKAISRYDFEWEVHPVTTQDGYKLNMFRLIGPKPDSDLYIRNPRKRIVKDTEYFYPDRIRELKEV